MKLLQQFARWVLKDYVVKLPRFPYVAEFEPMKPRDNVITFVKINEKGSMREAKTEDDYNDMMASLHDNYVQQVSKH